MNSKPFILLKWVNPYQDLMAEAYLPLPLRMGRSRKVDLTLHSNEVSRQHVYIGIDRRGRPFLRDLNSQNGTRVNAKRTKYTVLDAGDRITIGPYTMTVSRIGMENRLDRKVILQRYVNVLPDISTMPIPGIVL